MAGALLRSGSLTEFCPLGAVGKPVYSAASQLRAAIRRRAGDETAAVFAIPKQNEQGDIIDWYAPVAGDVIPWSAASAEERSEAQSALQAARTRLAELSRSLLNGDPDGRKSTELQVFGKLLAQATEIPSDDHIYLVQGKPAITFWGFHPLNAPPGYDVISNLDVGGAAVKAPAVAPAAEPTQPAVPLAAEAEEEPRRGWWRWWWLLLPLLLLLFLLLLWIGLRMWGVELPFAPSLTVPVVVEETKTPVSTAERDSVLNHDGSSVIQGSDGSSVDIRGGDRRIVYDSDGVAISGRSDDRSLATGAEASRDGGPGGGPADAIDAAEAGDPVRGADVAEPLEPQTADPAASADETGLPEPLATDEAGQPDPSATDETGLPEPAATDEAGQPEPPEMPDPAATSDQAGQPEPPATSDPGMSQGEDGVPLTIPAQSVRDGDTAFLDGGWQSGTGLQDTSGNPIQLGYTFKGGEGAVTMQRAVGDRQQTCTGPARSAMESGQLVITQGAIQCPDGTTFNAPRVVCTVGAGGRADCEGANEDGTAFPVSITR